MLFTVRMYSCTILSFVYAMPANVQEQSINLCRLIFLISAAVLAQGSSSSVANCGTFLNHRVGAVFNALVDTGEFDMVKSSKTCPGEDSGTSPPLPPQQHSHLLLQKKVNNETHFFVRRLDAVEIFAITAEGCERHQRISLSGTPHMCISSTVSELKVVCVTYDPQRSRVEVYTMAAPSSTNASWTPTSWFAASSCHTHPYLYENLNTYSIHLVFGSGNDLVSYTPLQSFNVDTIPPPDSNVGSVRELYVLRSQKDLIVDFSSSAYTYSLLSAKFSPYITPLPNYFFTDLTVATNSSSHVSASTFNHTNVQVTFSENNTQLCAIMQVPNNTQVEYVQFYSTRMLLSVVSVNHSVLYTIKVDDIRQLLEGSATPCRNISFEDLSAPLVRHTHIGGCSPCGNFAINGPFLLASNCSNEGSATDVYVLEPITYVGTFEGVAACDLEITDSHINTSQCLKAILSGDSTTPITEDNDSHPNATSHPTPSVSPLTPTVVIILSLVVLVIVGIVVTLIVLFVIVSFSGGRDRRRRYPPKKGRNTRMASLSQTPQSEEVVVTTDDGDLENGRQIPNQESDDEGYQEQIGRN